MYALFKNDTRLIANDFVDTKLWLAPHPSLRIPAQYDLKPFIYTQISDPAGQETT